MNYHLIGIEGSMMSGLAEILRSRGHRVKGTDLRTSGHGPDKIATDTNRIVYTPAVREESPAWAELQAARDRHLDMLRSDELLGELTLGRKLLAVTGAHGKSSTTAMLAHILLETGYNPTALLGAPVPGWEGRNYHVGDDELWVLEADDYDRKFLTLHPTIAVVTNIDREHLDVYRSLDDIQDAFRTFVSHIIPGGYLVASTDASLDAIVSAGSSEVTVIRYGPGGQVQPSELPKLHVIGSHMYLNAAGAVAAAEALGAPLDEAKQALVSFLGTGRRLEYIGQRGGVLVYDDYAHHPTEIVATLQALKETYPNQRLVVAFQPHQHSRVRALFDEFSQCFGQSDRLLLVDVYAVPGRNEGVHVEAADLATAMGKFGTNVKYVGSLDQLSKLLPHELTSGDIFLTMGATNITTIGRTWVAEGGDRASSGLVR